MRTRPSHFLLPTLLCAALAAAEPLSLDRCVDMAADNSWTMREAAVSLRQAKSDLDVARAARGLSVSANAGHNVSQRPFVRKDVGQNSSVGLSASLPLYSGGSVSANVERSEAKLLQQEATVAELRREVALTVVSHYLSHFEWLDEIDWRTRSVEACESSLDRTRALFEAGQALESDTLLAAGSCATDRASLESARDGADYELRMLRQLVGLDADAPLELVPVDTAVFESISLPEDLERLIAEALEGSPRARADSLSLAAAQASLKAASARVKVNLSASASTGIDWTPDDYGDELRNQYVHSVSLSVSVPLLDRGAISGAVASARLGKEQALISLERDRRQFRDEIEALWRSLRLNLARMPSADLSLRAAEQSYAHAQSKLEAGKLSTFELLQEKSSLEQARLARQRVRWSVLSDSMSLRIHLGQGEALK